MPILGSAACGEPIYKPGDGTEFISVEDDLPCDFALIAQGDSMTGDRIYSGDIVFIRSQDHVQDGEIAAVALDNEVTLKHGPPSARPGWKRRLYSAFAVKPRLFPD